MYTAIDTRTVYSYWFHLTAVTYFQVLYLFSNEDFSSQNILAMTTYRCTTTGAGVSPVSMQMERGGSARPLPGAGLVHAPPPVHHSHTSAELRAFEINEQTGVFIYY